MTAENYGIKALRVLLVEDNPGDADLIRERAEEDERRALSIDVCATLADAIETLNKTAPDVIVLDLGLPDSLGFATFERMHQAAPETPLIVLTGQNDLTVAEKCIEHGAHDYLIKGKVEGFIAQAVHNTVARAAAQKALAEVQENLKRMLSDTQDAIIVLGQDDTVKFANNAARRLFGEGAAEGRTFAVIPSGECSQEFEASRADGTKAALEMRVGETVWNGEAARVVTLRDITERRAAEKSLAQSERLLTFAIEQMPVPVVVTDAPEGRISRYNRALVDTMAVKPRDMGSIALDDHCTYWPAVHQDGTAYRLEDLPLTRAVREGVTTSNRELILPRDGKDQWLSVSAAPLRDDQGNVVAGIAVFLDITDLMHAEASLRERQRMLDDTGRMAKVGGWKHDFATGKAVWTKALHEIMGIPCDEEPPGVREHYAYYPAQDRLTLKKAYDLARDEGVPFDLELQVRTAGKKTLWCRVHGEPVYESGSCTGMRGTFQDVSQRKSVECQARKVEAMLRNAQEMAHLGAWEFDLASNRLTWCDQVYAIFGLRPEEFDGTREAFIECIHPDDRSAVDAGYLESVSGGEEGFEFEYRIIGKTTREVRYVHEKCFHEYDASGKVVRSVGMVQDVTDRRKVENLLRARMQMLEFAELRGTEEFLQYALDIVCEMSHSAIGFCHFVEADQKTLSLQAWSSRTLEEFCTAEGKGIHYSLDDAGVWADCIRLRRPVIHNDYLSLPQRKGLPEGHARVVRELVVPVVRGGSIVAVLGVGNKPTDYTDKDSEVVSYLADISWEIAENKRIEAQRARLAAAIDQAGEMVVVTDRKGDIEYVNPVFERITGYSRDEIQGKNTRLLGSGTQDEAFYQDLWATISCGETWRGRMVNRRKDGSLFTEDSTISPVRDASGTIINYVAVKNDVTEHLKITREKSEIEEQMRQTQKLESIGRLAGGVAHDFNNMLSVIIGYGEELINSLHDSDPLKECATAIVEAGNRSASLTRQLLAFSRKQTLRPEVLNLNDIVRNLEKMLQRLIGEDVELVTELDEELSPVEVDAGQIEQVIMNLAVNARDAMPQGGTLTIETALAELDEAYAEKYLEVVPGAYVLMTVSDTGAGMDEETKKKLFEPFFTTKEAGKGTGLGLSTVYGIVKQSGGGIKVTSRPGQGSSFAIYLPQACDVSEKKPGASVIPRAMRGEASILVVEDEASLRKLIGRTLTSMKYRATTAANAGEALLLVEEKGLRPDLIITDVVMPGMSGKVLVDRLMRILPDLKVIYMSGYTDDAVAEHIVREPGMPFLQKPFNVRRLAEKIDLLLSDGEGEESRLRGKHLLDA